MRRGRIGRGGISAYRLFFFFFSFFQASTLIESRFYYGDQRKADGGPVYSEIDGDAHAKLYLELAEEKAQGPWQQTFVSGVGYKDFTAA